MSEEETGTRFAFYSSIVLYPRSHLHLTTIQLTLREILMVRTYKYTDVAIDHELKRSCLSHFVDQRACWEKLQRLLFLLLLFYRWFLRMSSLKSLANSEDQLPCRSENSSLLPIQSNAKRNGRCRINLVYTGYILYLMLLLWLIAGSVLYFVRAYFCCIKERHTSFRCSNVVTFPHSQELELAWLLSQVVCMVTFAFFLRKVPGFLGYSVIFGKAIRLPTFWSITLLQMMETIGFAIIIYFSDLTKMQISLVVSFCLHGMSLIAIMSVLNFTPVNPVKNIYNNLALLICKLTLIVLFVQIFIIFTVGSVQFAFKVTGLDDLGKSANFVKVFRQLREFPQVIFYYKASVFFFHKLFLDNKNILSSGEYLKLRNEQV